MNRGTRFRVALITAVIALALGAAAFGLWGLFPLYWPLLEPAAASEILAHRILWSLIVTAGLLLVTRRTAALRAIWGDRRARLALTGEAISEVCAKPAIFECIEPQSEFTAAYASRLATFRKSGSQATQDFALGPPA